jgi:hypothetical protein
MYSNDDARYDYEQLHGPICPTHGTNSCDCCFSCGAKEEHAEWCEYWDGDIEEV